MNSCSDYVYCANTICGVCQLAIYRDGKQLPCGHPLCSSCMMTAMSGGKCPMCGAAFLDARDFVESRPQAVADTNVFEVKLHKLAESCPIATGDPVFCRNCSAVLNCFSSVASEEAGQFWTCEFCSHRNPLTLDPAEIPKSDQVTYILDPVSTTATEQSQGEDSTTCIFCIDTSGSMGTAVTIPTPIAIKGGKPTNRPSRLNCVMAAIEAQVIQMLERSPDRHIGVVEFESSVTVHGDGHHSEPLSANFSDFDALLSSVAGKHDLLIGRSLTQAKNELLTKVFNLIPRGMTALGPGLTVSIALAMQGKPGSKVIICTDGIANLGLGSIESDSAEVAGKFYDTLGQLAQSNGVCVSVISVTDAECRLSFLSTIANMTEGNVLSVNPATMADDFSNILQERIIATEAHVRVTMHKGLKFKNEKPDELQFFGSQLVRTIGNISQFSSFTFEYAIKTAEEMQISEVDLAGVTQLPFQLIIEYRNLAGQRCVKSFAKVLKLSTDKASVEQKARYSVLERNYCVQQARHVELGLYEAMQHADQDYQDILSRAAGTMEEQQRREEVVGAVALVRSECDRQVASERERGVQMDEAAMEPEELRRRRMEMRSDKATTTTTKLRGGKPSIVIRKI